MFCSGPSVQRSGDQPGEGLRKPLSGEAPERGEETAPGRGRGRAGALSSEIHEVAHATSAHAGLHPPATFPICQIK